MICVAALIVFGVLAIFSAKYRPLAKEAFKCVFLKIRLRPCQSGLDQRVRMAATMPFMKRAPKLAKLIYKYFSWLSTAFVILSVLSVVYIGIGLYNYAEYGNCNGPGSSGFCIFDPSGPGSSTVAECTDKLHVPEALIKPLPDNLSEMKMFNPDANFTVIFFGCYACPYSRKAAQPLLQEIQARPDVKFILVDFPIEAHPGALAAATAGDCAYDENRSDYLSYASKLFTANLSQGIPAYDNPEFSSCAAVENSRVTAGIALGVQTGIYGTPTYFIGDKPFVGPLNRNALDKLINDAMGKSFWSRIFG